MLGDDKLSENSICDKVKNFKTYFPYPFAVYLRVCVWCTFMLLCDILTCLFVTYLLVFCGIPMGLFAVYLHAYLRCSYVLFYLKIIVWCVGIIINFYCSTHPSLTPEYWKKYNKFLWLLLQGGFNLTVDRWVAIGVFLVLCAMRGARWWMAHVTIAG